jgi:hypothetical protein
MANDCEHGYHAVLVAREPVDSGDSVEIDHVCTACGAIEYTVSWTKKAWLEHEIKELERLRQARRKTRDKQVRDCG